MKTWSMAERVGLLAALLLLVLMPSGQSLWIDEAFNADFARRERFGEFLEHFLSGLQSENQMPLGMFASWLGGRLFGTSEWQLRAINLGWGALGVLSLAGVGRRLRMPWLPLLLSVQPFFWFYMDEARPYAMQIGCAALILYSLVEFYEGRGEGRGWLIAFCLGAFGLCASSLLGVLPFAAMTVCFGWLAWKIRWRPTRGQQRALGLLLVALALLGAFYVWTLLRGAKGALLWKVGPGNIFQAVYDFAGFSGLGPARAALRTAGRGGSRAAAETLLPFVGPVLFLGLQYAALAFRRPFAAFRGAALPGGIAGVVALSLVIVTVTCAVRGFPFWSRHLAPVFPFYVTTLALALQGGQPVLGRVSRWSLFLLCGTLLASSLEIRFAPRHAKDDYRSAAQAGIAAVAGGQTVWWSADALAAGYYGLTVAKRPPYTAAAIYLSSPGPAEIATLPPPDLVIASKPDLYDDRGEIAAYLSAHGFRAIGRFPAFTIWAAPGKMVD